MASRPIRATVIGSVVKGTPLNREDAPLARCTMARLMREMGLQGAVRGRRFKTTISDKTASRPPDLVDRDFTGARPDQRWVSDLSFVATWPGFVYVAFVIDTFARRLVGWGASRSLRKDCAPDALEQALYDRVFPSDIALWPSTLIQQGRGCFDGRPGEQGRGISFRSPRLRECPLRQRLRQSQRSPFDR